MRITVTLLAAALLAPVPAIAAPQSATATEAPEQMAQEATALLNDPKVEQTIGQAMRVLSDTLLNMKVGELKALTEGRKVTDADANVTVRDLARRKDPEFEAKMRARIDSAGPMIQAQTKALVAALPGLMRNMEGMAKSLERIGANIPDPSYPKR